MAELEVTNQTVSLGEGLKLANQFSTTHIYVVFCAWYLARSKSRRFIGSLDNDKTLLNNRAEIPALIYIKEKPRIAVCKFQQRFAQSTRVKIIKQTMSWHPEQ